MVAHLQKEVTEWLIELLGAVGRPVGDHKAPAGTIDSLAPYCIVYSIPGGGRSGPPFRAPEADKTFAFQVTSVGKNRGQAQWMADMVDATITGRGATGAFQVAGPDISALTWRVVDRLGDDATGGVDPQGQPPTQVFNVPVRYLIQTTPA